MCIQDQLNPKCTFILVHHTLSVSIKSHQSRVVETKKIGLSNSGKLKEGRKNFIRKHIAYFTLCRSNGNCFSLFPTDFSQISHGFPSGSPRISHRFLRLSTCFYKARSPRIRALRAQLRSTAVLALEEFQAATALLEIEVDHLDGTGSKIC